MQPALQNIVRLALVGLVALSLAYCSSTPKSDPTAAASTATGSGSGTATTNSPGSSSGSQPAGDTGTQTDPDVVGLTATDWDVIYNGEGSVVFDAEGILMTPKAATLNGETHAALLLAKKTETQLLQNFKATITYTNILQLRTDVAPKAWEVFWLFFNYTLDGVGKKMTNYVVIKTNGTEIGRAYNEVDQEFLVTNASPLISIGTTHVLTVTKNGSNVTVLLDGQPAADFTSEVSPSAKYIYDVPGSIGLYCEDAQVRVSNVVIEALP